MAKLSEQKKQQRALWGTVGDYAAVAGIIQSVSDNAVEAADVSKGDKVLDVACGTGNATIPAAKAGAKATGLDIAPELLESAKARAADEGVEVTWVEGDAENLPFEDAGFDKVLSVFGCMFAPDHKRAAAELARVLAPGGKLAVCGWTPEGAIGEFFMTVGSFMPPPPEGFQPPVLWGNEDHVREIFEGTGLELAFDRAMVDMDFESTEAAAAYYEEKLPPLANAKANLEPEKWQELRAAIVGHYEARNASSDGDFKLPCEYLLISATKGE